MPLCRIPTQLRSYTGGADEVRAAGATLAELFAELDRRFPGLRFRVIDEQGHVRRHMVVFVGSERRDDLGAPLADADEVFIMGALSGG
jgi:molybdopterin synthase sulfur carrier subunit